MRTCQFVLERELHVAGIQRRSLDEAEAVLARKLLRLLRRHRAQVSQIALVAHQHDHNIRVRVIAQLLQPSCHVLVGLMLADVVDEQRTDGAAVVGGGDGAVAFLPRSVPDLGFDGLAVDLDAAGCEFDADGGFAVEVEFVAGEAREQVGFADPRIAYQHHFEEELCNNQPSVPFVVRIFCARQSYIIFVVGHIACPSAVRFDAGCVGCIEVIGRHGGRLL